MEEGASDAVFSDQCVACDSNCKTCFLESYRCQSCPDGFRLSGSNRCIGLYTVKFNIVFDIDFSTFTGSYMSEVLVEIVAGYLGLNIEDIYINRLVSGSTDTEIIVSADSQQQSDSVANVDVNSIAESSPNAYFPVLSSSSTVLYNDEEIDNDEEEDQAGNTAVIIGVVIGVIVLFVIGAFIVYKLIQNKKRHTSAPVGTSEGSQNVIVNPEMVKIEDQIQRDNANLGMANFKVMYA